MSEHKLFLVTIKREFEMFVCAKDEAQAKATAEANMEDEALSSDDKDGSLKVAAIRRFNESDVESSPYDLDAYLPWGAEPQCLHCECDIPVAEWFDSVRWEEFLDTLSSEEHSMFYCHYDGPIEWDLMRDREALRRAIRVYLDEQNEFEEKNQESSELDEMENQLADMLIKKARAFWPKFETVR